MILVSPLIVPQLGLMVLVVMQFQEMSTVLDRVDFSDTNTTFDSGINKFDDSFDLPILERFDSTSFSLDNSNKTFDIGDVTT